MPRYVAADSWESRSAIGVALALDGSRLLWIRTHLTTMPWHLTASSKRRLTIVVTFAVIAGCAWRVAGCSRQQVMSGQARADLIALRTKIDEFRDTKGRLPAAQGELYSWMRLKTGWPATTVTDPWGREYRFDLGPEGIERVYTLGRDGVPGGDGWDQDVFDSDVMEDVTRGDR